MAAGRAFPGPAAQAGSEGNRAGDMHSGAAMREGCDWGLGRLCAYAQGTGVVVVDPGSCQVVATLDRHAASVVCVRWVGEAASAEGGACVASGDAMGTVCVWDVKRGVVAASMSCGAGRGSVIAIRTLRRHMPRNAPPTDHTPLRDPTLPYRLLCATPSAVLFVDLATQGVLWRVDVPGVSLVGLVLSPRNDAVVYTTDSRIAVLPEVASKATGRTLHWLTVTGAAGVLQDVQPCPSVRHHVYLAYQTEVVLFNTHVRQRVDTFRAVAPRAEFRNIFVTPSAEEHAMTSVLGLSGPAPVYTMCDDGSLCAWVAAAGERGAPTQHAQPVDCRSSRQGYAGRPYLVAMERPAAAGTVVDREDHLLARFAVVTNDGVFAVWEYTPEGWVLASSLPCVPGPAACMSVVQLPPHPSAALFSTAAYDAFAGQAAASPAAPSTAPHIVLITQSGTLVVLAANTGRLVCKTDVMTEKGTVPVGVHGLGTDGLLMAARRTVEAAGPKGGGDGGLHMNYIAVLRYPDCSVRGVLKGHRAEPQKLISVSVSASHKYASALHMSANGQPCLCEVWDLDSLVIVSRVSFKETQAGPGLVSWLPPRAALADDAPNAPIDAFVWVHPDNSVAFQRISTGQHGPVASKKWVVNGKTQIALAMASTPTSVDWFERMLVVGDAAGCIGVVNLETEKVGVFHSQRKGGVKQLAVCPSQGDASGSNICHAAVLFDTGDFGLWNVAAKQCVSRSDDLRVSATCIAWLPGPLLAACTSDGAVHILPPSLATSTSAVAVKLFTRPLQTTAFLNPAQKTLLRMLVASGGYPAWLRETSTMGLMCDGLWAHLEGVEGIEPASIIRRSFIAASVLADEDGMQFWRTVEVALAAQKVGATAELVHPSLAARRESESASAPEAARPVVNAVLEDGAAEACGGVSARDELLLNNTLLHTVDAHAAAAMERAVRESGATREYGAIAQQHVMLGDISAACQLLLDTPTTAGEWRGNLYKACTMAAGVGPQHYRRMTARVASMFIAHGDIDSGVELLCATGRAEEACRAYQAAERWDDAARLAKVSLPAADAYRILQEWAHHLAGTSVVAGACVLAATGDFAGTVRYLVGHDEHTTAALLAAATHVHIADKVLVASVCTRHAEGLRAVGCNAAGSAFDIVAQTAA